MRKFRSDRINLADPRIAYTLLLSISLICTIMGLLASRAERRLTSWQLDDCYRTLSECADALDVWADAEFADDKSAAALRFRSAVTSLPEGVNREPLLTLADAMRTNDATAAQSARTLADTFTLLAAFEYPDTETAQEMIAAALLDVSGSLLPAEAEPESAAGDALGIDTSRYSLSIAENAVMALFGSNGSTIACEASSDGSVWTAETDNLRMVFSAFDGSLESFVYIRLGNAPDVICTESELLERTAVFAGEKLGLGKITDAALVDSLGGFSVVEFVSRAGEYRAVLDQSGRVWSMVKVKR